MSTYKYRVSTDFPAGLLLRKKENENGYCECVEVFDVRANNWVQKDEYMSYFIGFEPSYEISEEEAMKLVKEA